MRCHICDANIAEFQFNSEHGDIDPCTTCLAVVQDTLESFKDKPSASEDDFSDDLADIMSLTGEVSFPSG